MNLAEQVKIVRTREDFIAFLTELCKDYRENGKSWENDNLGSFLEALAAWTADMDGYYVNKGKPVPKTPEWKTLAEMLVAAKFYE